MKAYEVNEGFSDNVLHKKLFQSVQTLQNDGKLTQSKVDAVLAEFQKPPETVDEADVLDDIATV